MASNHPSVYMNSCHLIKISVELYSSVTVTRLLKLKPNCTKRDGQKIDDNI